MQFSDRLLQLGTEIISPIVSEEHQNEKRGRKFCIHLYEGGPMGIIPEPGLIGYGRLVAAEGLVTL